MHMLSVFWPKLHNRQAMHSDVQRFAASPCFGSQFYDNCKCLIYTDWFFSGLDVVHIACVTVVDNALHMHYICNIIVSVAEQHALISCLC